MIFETLGNSRLLLLLIFVVTIMATGKLQDVVSAQNVTTVSTAEPFAKKTDQSLDAWDKAILFSQGNDSTGRAKVGIRIYVSEKVKSKGFTGDDVGRPLVDSLGSRGITAQYFFEDSYSGAPTTILVIVGNRLYKNAVGQDTFNPLTINAEFDGIKKLSNIPYVGVVATTVIGTDTSVSSVTKRSFANWEQARDHSKGNAEVGVAIYVSEAMKKKGITGNMVGEAIVDSLATRKVKAAYFIEDAPPGIAGNILVFVDEHVYKNVAGKDRFGIISIFMELDGIRKMRMSRPITSFSH